MTGVQTCALPISNIESNLQDSKNHTNTKSNAAIESNIESNIESKNTESNNNTESKNTEEKDGRIKSAIRGANDLSLGISMIVAVLLGLGLGYLLYNLTGYYWLLWVGLGYGVAAAALNVAKAYKRLHKELDEIKDDEKYKYIIDNIIEKKDKS